MNGEIIYKLVYFANMQPIQIEEIKEIKNIKIKYNKNNE